MSVIDKHYLEKIFEVLNIEELPSNLYFYFCGESSRFYRINKSRIRQVTFVDQSELTICQKNDEDENIFHVQLSGIQKKDLENINDLLEINAKSFTPDLPVLNKIECSGLNQIDFNFLDNFKEDDLVGIISDGELRSGACRGGDRQLHWFETQRSDIDYSIFKSDRCVKEFFSLKNISAEGISSSIINNKNKLEMLCGEKVKLSPGLYPAYFSPSAVNEMLGMFNWHGIQGKSFAEKQSAFMDLYEQKRKFSSNFNLRENFSLKLSPRFNQEAELSQEFVEIIKGGELVTPLVNSVSARKYGMLSNNANSYESLRSAEILPGDKPQRDLINQVREGLYITNLHYLNWSNKKNAMITGMTRYGCCYIDEKGIKNPIEDMRFNMSLYDIFGEWLIEFSKEMHVFSESSTYSARTLGGTKVPGVLSSINFTL
jgi:hypothetical protein